MQEIIDPITGELLHFDDWGNMYGGGVEWILAKPRQYTKQKEIKDIVKKYEIKMKKRKSKKRILIICHGNAHIKYKYLPLNQALTLDLNIGAKPDIVGDAWSVAFMKRLPVNYFTDIYIVYCPLADPTGKINDPFWKNIKRILSKDGKFYGDFIYSLYQMRHRGRSSERLKNDLYSYFQKFFKKISFLNVILHAHKGEHEMKARKEIRMLMSK